MTMSHLSPFQFKHRDVLLRFLPQNGVVAEVGVLCGDFSQVILNHSRPRKLHLIDAWRYQAAYQYPDTAGPSAPWFYSQKRHDLNYCRVLTRFTREIKSGKICVHKGFSHHILSQFPERYFDWIYLDAHHGYENVKQDLELSAQKLKQGGLIVGDDYFSNQLSARLKYGVVQAVDEFCRNHRWEITCFASKKYQGVDYKNYVLARTSEISHFHYSIKRKTLQKFVCESAWSLQQQVKRLLHPALPFFSQTEKFLSVTLYILSNYAKLLFQYSEATRFFTHLYLMKIGHQPLHMSGPDPDKADINDNR